MTSSDNEESWGACVDDSSHQPSRLRGALSFRSKEVGGYRLGKTLGKGSCAVVKLGIHRDTGKHAAIKILKPRTLREQKEALREIEALQRLHHPNITRLHQVIRENGYTCIILELSAGGELFDYVMNAGKIDEEEARFMFRQILSGLQYCHANLVAHRDIKPENLLLDEYGNIKISDFGLSNVIKPGRLFSTWCGSPVYTPPEVVLRQQYSGVSMDIWSLGVVLYVLVTGGMPWRLESNVVRNMDDLIAGNYEIPDFLGVSEECKELIGTMLIANSSERATLQEVMNHKWTCEGFEGPPNPLLEAKPLVTDVNENIFAQLETLGYDLKKAREDLKTNPTSAALTAYHLLLSKHHRAIKVKSCQPADAANVNSPKQFLNTVTRTRSKTYPTPPPVRSPAAYRKESSADDVHRLAAAAAPVATAPPTITKQKSALRLFLDKFKRSSKKQTNNDATTTTTISSTSSSSKKEMSNTKQQQQQPQLPRPITMVVQSHNSPSPSMRRRM